MWGIWETPCRTIVLNLLVRKDDGVKKNRTFPSGEHDGNNQARTGILCLWQVTEMTN